MKRTTEGHIDCEDVLRQLLAYLDHEVDEHAAALIERHLEACRACFTRAAFERQQQTKIDTAGKRTDLTRTTNKEVEDALRGLNPTYRI